MSINVELGELFPTLKAAVGPFQGVFHNGHAGARCDYLEWQIFGIPHITPVAELCLDGDDLPFRQAQCPKTVELNQVLPV